MAYREPTTTQSSMRAAILLSIIGLARVEAMGLFLPHGGLADFRGKDKAVFNLLSAQNVSVNALFEAADFAWGTKLVHGTQMAAAYWTLRTASDRVLNIEYEAQKRENWGVVHEEKRVDVHIRPESEEPVTIDNVELVMLSHKTFSVTIKDKWRLIATASPYPFGKLNGGKVLIDAAIQQLYDADADRVSPHGIIGQAYDGDATSLDVKLDGDEKGESTTAAQAEGAIEGSWEDYMMPTKFATRFKYSRFDVPTGASVPR